MEQAKLLATKLVEDFQDQQNGGFYFTAARHEDLLMRSKSLGDGGNLPDANGVAVEVLLDLATILDRPAYLTAAKRTLGSLPGLSQQSPFSAEYLLLAAAEFLGRPTPSPAPSDAATIEPDDAPNPEFRQHPGPVTIRACVSRLSVKPGESLDVAVALDIDDGWHLYGQNPNADFLVPSTVSIEPSALFVAGQIAAPEPHRAIDSIIKRTLNTYAGRIWFRGPVKVNAGARVGTTTLTLSVTTQACDANGCLPPEKTIAHISLQVDPEATAHIRHPKIFEADGSSK